MVLFRKSKRFSSNPSSQASTPPTSPIIERENAIEAAGYYFTGAVDRWVSASGTTTPGSIHQADNSSQSSYAWLSAGGKYQEWKERRLDMELNLRPPKASWLKRKEAKKDRLAEKSSESSTPEWGWEEHRRREVLKELADYEDTVAASRTVSRS